MKIPSEMESLKEKKSASFKTQKGREALMPFVQGETLLEFSEERENLVRERTVYIYTRG